jgi:hypothetical protein
VSPDAANTNAPTNAVATDTGDEETGILGIYQRMPTWLKLSVLALAIVVLAVVIAIWRDFYFHWFEVHTGINKESGVYYAFWSGFGSDISEATIVVGILAAWRHHNCHVQGCPRLGRHVEGTAYIACPKHHPGHEGTKRGVSVETIRKAHKQANSRSATK